MSTFVEQIITWDHFASYKFNQE